jgi:hypothetical protein
MREQLETAGMQTRQRCDRHAGIYAADGFRGEHHIKVDRAGHESLAQSRAKFHGNKADIGESFRAE